jgi:hypothetical protein
MNKQQLAEAMATETGHRLVKGPKRGSGYVLIDENGDMPFGQDHSASLDDVIEYLTPLVDVEESQGAELPPPLTDRQVAKAAREHPEAEAITWLDENGKPKLTPAQRREQNREEERQYVEEYGTLGMRRALWTDQMSDEEARRWSERAREVAAKRKAEHESERKSHNLRDYGVHKVSVDDIAFEEKARRKSNFATANYKLQRTNIASRADGAQDEDEDLPFRRDTWLTEEERNFQPPPANHDPAPKPAAGFTKETNKDRRSRVTASAESLASLRSAADKRWLDQAGPVIKKMIDDGDCVAAGTMLADAEERLRHGEWTTWLERHGTHPRTARRYLAKTKTDKTDQES